MKDLNIDELAKEIYEQNKAVGWWDDPNRCTYTTLQLVSTEIAEATEAERKDLMDSHLPERKGGEVELADAMIRVLDLGGRYGWKHLNHYDDTGTDEMKEQMFKTIGGKHCFLNVLVSTMVLSVTYDDDAPSTKEECYSRLIDSIIEVAKLQGYNLWDAVFEKLDYNRKRKDHERSERAKPGGKKF